MPPAGGLETFIAQSGKIEDIFRRAVRALAAARRTASRERDASSGGLHDVALKVSSRWVAAGVGTQGAEEMESSTTNGSYDRPYDLLFRARLRSVRLGLRLRVTDR